MQSRDFCYWLQGFFELGGESGEIGAAQAATIRRHLDMVFAHELNRSLFEREPARPPVAPPRPKPAPPPKGVARAGARAAAHTCAAAGAYVLSGASMSPKEFCIWLNAMLDGQARLARDGLTREETAAIRQALSQVFRHAIDPTFGDAEHLARLRWVHEGR